MDFRFTPEEQAFREEVRTFLRETLPPGWAGGGSFEGDTAEQWLLAKDVTRKLGAKGWLAMAWPKQYGGLEASHIQQLIFNEEVAYYRVPLTSTMGIGWVGPALMIYGSDEQKRAHLPRIAGGEVQWCTGYSEPGSGSDLASLQTRAVRDGDDYIITGQKIWTTGAHHSDWCWLAARTDPDAPKHRGISLYLVDMKSPGVSVRPIINMARVHSLNEMFFDNVRVPNGDLVGEENRGWYQVAVALDFERSGVGRAASARRNLEEIVACAKGAGVRLKPQARHRLAELAIEVEACRLLCYRVAWMQSRGMPVNAEASSAKVYGSELLQRVAAVGTELFGLYGQVESPRRAPLAGALVKDYLDSVSHTIAAGTSEIQRNVIATRGLGLPR